MEDKKEAIMYHAIRLGKGATIYLPTSIPNRLKKFINPKNLVQDKELDKFKQKIIEK